MSQKAAGAKGSEAPKTLFNRKARHNYEFLDTFEAGIVLVGSEVKSVWLGRVNMTDAYADIRSDEVWLINLDIEPYEYATNFQPERRRDRKLLLKRAEIELIHRRVREKGLTLVASKIYFSDRGRVKVEIALARGKREYDKRKQLAEQETRREVERARNERG